MYLGCKLCVLKNLITFYWKCSTATQTTPPSPLLLLTTLVLLSLALLGVTGGGGGGGGHIAKIATWIDHPWGQVKDLINPGSVFVNVGELSPINMASYLKSFYYLWLSSINRPNNLHVHICKLFGLLVEACTMTCTMTSVYGSGNIRANSTMAYWENWSDSLRAVGWWASKRVGECILAAWAVAMTSHPQTNLLTYHNV